MQGIEILNKEPVTITTEPEWLAMGIIISFLLFFVFLTLAGTFFGDLLGGISLVLAIGCWLFLICGDEIKVKSTDGRYRYEAIIDDDVSINEVYKHYNVIEQDGKKWILEDKAGAE